VIPKVVNEEFFRDVTPTINLTEGNFYQKRKIFDQAFAWRFYGGLTD